nr:cytochrome c1 [Acetobacter persici]
MPPPLRDNAVLYADGTQPTAQQEARDVTTFLAWVSSRMRMTNAGWGLGLCCICVFSPACLLS